MAINEDTLQLTLAAFHEIMASGSKPTVDLVLSWMNANGYDRRNRNAISTALKQCWADLAAKTTVDPRLQDLPQEAVDLVLKLHRVLFADAERTFSLDLQDAKTELANKLADAQRRVNAATADAEAAREGLATEVAARGRADTMIRDLQDRLATQEGLLQAAAGAKADVDRVLAAQRDQTASLERQLAAVEAARKSEIDSEASRFEEMQHALQLRLDEARTERDDAKAVLLTREESLNRARTEMRDIERGANVERLQISTELAAARGEVKALQDLQVKSAAELGEALRHAGQATQRADQAEAAAAQLSRDVETLQQRVPLTPDAFEQMIAGAVAHGNRLPKATGAKGSAAKLSIDSASVEYAARLRLSLK